MNVKLALVNVSLVTLLGACTLNTDDYEIKNVSVNPEFSVPLATGHLTIQDILDQTDSAYIKVYGDGLVYLSYSDTLASQDIRDLVDLPNLGTISRSLSFPAGTYPPSTSDVQSTVSSSTVDMGISPEKLTEISFKSGSMNYAMSLVPPNSAVAYSVTIRIPEFISDTTGNPFQQTASGTNSISLVGYTYKSNTANTFTLQLTLVIKAHATPYVIAPGTNLNVSINYSGADFKYIKGFLGDQVATPDPQSMEIGTFGDFLADGTVSFADPKIQFKVISDYGVPLQVSFLTLEGRKDGSSVAILTNPASPIPITAPLTLGQSATTSVSITNVNQLFNFGPSEFYYQVSGHINNGLTSGNNFLADTSKMRVKLDVELPLYGKVSDIVLGDTTDLDLGDLDESQIETAEIKAIITNELPLDAEIQIVLLNESDGIIDVLLTAEQSKLVKGSTVNASGDLQTAGVFDGVIPLDQAKVNKIFSASKMAITAKLSSSKNASGTQVDVKFKAPLTIDVKLGLKVKLKLNADL
jgi:hypothetical protein